MTDKVYPAAPSWEISQWFNTPESLTLEMLRGKIIALHTFQMLCPGCVAHGLPKAIAMHRLFANQGVVVIGLHTVFEHHQAMTPLALEAFIHEYGLTFPIGVDRPAADSPVPCTMQAYGFRGTPSLVLIDGAGQIRLHAFGQIDDLQLGVQLGRLLAEVPADESSGGSTAVNVKPDCNDEGCAPRTS